MGKVVLQVILFNLQVKKPVLLLPLTPPQSAVLTKPQILSPFPLQARTKYTVDVGLGELH